MLRSLIALKQREVPIRVALRNTLGVVAPIAIGMATDQLAIGTAITSGALHTMFVDLPGSYRLRMQRMFIASAAAGLAALAGALIGAHTGMLVLAAAAIGTAGGLMVALGPVPARAGLTAMLVMIVTADMRVTPAEAVGIAGLVFSGGLLQMSLSLAAWPLQRYRPERFALADVLQGLAGLARARPDATKHSPVSQASMHALELLHGRFRTRGVAMQSFRIIAELCERVRIDLTALGDLYARFENQESRDRVERVVDAAEAIFLQLAQAMRAASPPQAGSTLDALELAIDALDAPLEKDCPARDRRLIRVATSRAQAIAGELRALGRNADWASSRGEIRAERIEARLPAVLRPDNPLQTLRANLSLSSGAMRHGLRCGFVLALAVTCERMLDAPHGVWFPMTAAIVLKPDFGGTMRYGVMRVVGTIAGLLLISVAAHVLRDEALLSLLLMAMLCFAFRLLAPVNYAIGVAMMTGMVVMLLSFNGVAPGASIPMRLVATLSGSTLALAAYALWPTWEGRRAPIAMANLIDSCRAHVVAVLRRDLDAMFETRNAARVARTNALASLERLRGEPGVASRTELARNEILIANAYRLIRAALSLEAVLRESGQLQFQHQIDHFAGRVDQQLSTVSEALRSNGHVKQVRLRHEERRLAAALEADDSDDPVRIALADACDRIADSIDTLSHLLRSGPHGAGPVAASSPAAG